jgi:hypothetical protein
MTRLAAAVAALLTVAGSAVAVAVAAPAALAAGGSFSVLSYNVAGLPEAISSAPTPRGPATSEIGRRIAGYDLVHLQEDFNYHANLYATDTHPYRTPTSGGAGIGSGLNTVADFPYDGDDFERVRWNSCQFDSGDCLTPKGFTFMRTRLGDGIYVDTYNLHTNAGVNPGDLASRADNLSQLSGFIATHSAGNAVIVMVDTNTRYTRAADTIASFAAANGLTDAWVQIERGGVPPVAGSDPLLCPEDTCEVVDKILYRGSRFVTLTATDYHNENAAFLNADGLMLSDHPPISAAFTWSTNPAYQFSEQYGGPHGAYFNDVTAVAAGARAATLTVRAGSRVDRIGLTLTDGTVLGHGGTGGTATSLTLADGEYLTAATLCQAKHNNATRIFSARFSTSAGRTLAAGTTTANCATRTAPAGWQIAGFHGRSGAAVDKIGFIYTRR